MKLMMVRPLACFLTAAIALGACASEPATRRGPRPELQINLGSYSNPTPPGKPDKQGFVYTLSSNDTLRYFWRKGFRTIRLPVNWERLQPKPFGPLNKAKLAELTDFLNRARKVGFRVIPDVHAFGEHNGHKLGSKELPTGALADFWTRLIKVYPGRFAGYDIMNEPHDMPSPQAWPEAAQKTVNAIRKIDRTTTIYVEGDDWASAGRWMQSNATLDIKDPARRLVYSAHVYFDKDTSGLYKFPYEKDGTYPEIAPERLRPFVNWLRLRGFKGHIGESGVPSDHPGWIKTLDLFLKEVTASGDVLVGYAYWAGGDWTDSWNITVQPKPDGKWTDRPQMKLLTDYIAASGGKKMKKAP
jgi:endoglucanase